LTPHLADSSSKFIVLITSYVLWAYSIPVAMSILVILLLRMADHKLPHQSMAASSWLALGPIGTSALAILVIGSDAPAIFATRGMAAIGNVAAGVGVVVGMLLWGLGLGLGLVMWWLALATLITARCFKAGIEFNPG
jgi:tellurite resistance protein TehA-like permease